MHIDLTDRGRWLGKVLWKVILIIVAWLFLSHVWNTIRRPSGYAEVPAKPVRQSPTPRAGEKPWYSETMPRPVAERKAAETTRTPTHSSSPRSSSSERSLDEVAALLKEAREDRAAAESARREQTRVEAQRDAESGRGNVRSNSGGGGTRFLWVYPVPRPEKREDARHEKREPEYRERPANPKPTTKPAPQEPSKPRPEQAKPKVEPSKPAPPKAEAPKSKPDVDPGKSNESTTKRPLPPVKPNLPATKPPVEKPKPVEKAPPAPTKKPAAPPKTEAGSKAPKANPGKAGGSRQPAPKPAPAPPKGKKGK